MHPPKPVSSSVLFPPERGRKKQETLPACPQTTNAPLDNLSPPDFAHDPVNNPVRHLELQTGCLFGNLDALWRLQYKRCHDRMTKRKDVTHPEQGGRHEFQLYIFGAGCTSLSDTHLS